MKFVFIDGYYDFPLSGLCTHDNQLCSFSLYSEWEDETILYKVCVLSKWEKIKRLLEKKLFEICVGKHWTYVNGKRSTIPFYYKWPQWFWKLVFKAYYFDTEEFVLDKCIELNQFLNKLRS